MGLQVNGRNVAAMRFNGRDAVEARCNGSVVWPVGEPPGDDRLRFVAEQAGSTITLTVVGTLSPVPVLEYSLDAGRTWTEFSCDNAPVITLANVGDTVWMRGENNLISKGPSRHLRFSMSGRIGAYGSILYLIRKDGIFSYLACLSCLFQDCESLTVAPDLPLYTTGRIGEGQNEMFSHMFENCTNLAIAPEIHLEYMSSWCCAYMFAGCTSLAKAPKLPATTLYYPGTYYTVENGEGCYYAMFRGCTSLTDAPELPATELSSSCYAYMFQNCTALVIPPDLPAEMLPHAGDHYGSHSSSPTCGCYHSMFRGCISLTLPPIIKAKYFENIRYSANGAMAYMFYGCTALVKAEIQIEDIPEWVNSAPFQYMFYGCSSLSEIHVYFKKWKPGDTYQSTNTSNWVNGVSPTGTFICPTELERTVGVSNIPNGWAVQREGRPYNWVRLTITKFCRNDGGTSQRFANAAEIKFKAMIDDEEIVLEALKSAANSTLSGRPASNAFDGDISTNWHTNYQSSSASYTNWIEMSSNPFDRISAFSFTPHVEGTDLDYPVNFRIAVADGSKKYETIKEFSGADTGWEKGVERWFQVTSE